MRKVSILIVLLAMIASYGFGQNDRSLARVQKIQGLEVYFMAEPLRDYEIVVEKSGGIQKGSMLTGGLVNEGIAGKATQFVKRVKKQAEKDAKEVDAVVYGGGKRIIGIKFKQDATEENKGISRVQKINGVEVYVLSEPLRDYETLVDKSLGIKGGSMITGGLINNSIEQDVAKFVKRIKRSDKSIEAIVYSAGKRAIGIKFK